MSEIQDAPIWPRETGITDLPADLSTLALASMADLRRQWETRQAEIEDKSAIQTFSDQLAREWAIETGQIENLYTIERGVTLTLIEQGFSAAVLERGSTDKPREQVLALITDQKDALEGMFDFVKQNRPLSTSYIKELHAAMTRSQSTTDAIDPQGNRIEVPLLHGEWKRTPNYPLRDGKRFLYCPPEQTPPEMDRLVEMHIEHMARSVPAEVEASWLHHRFTQIHPFQDGNGRIARALASLVLIRAGMFPLVVPLTEKSAYLDALEAADEGDLRPLVLTVARRQQASYQRANDLLVQMAPPSSTPGTAMERLAHAMTTGHMASNAQRNTTVAARFAQTRRSISDLLDQYVKALRTTRSETRAADHGDYLLAEVPAFFPNLHPETSLRAAPPVHRAVWRINVPFEWDLLLFVTGYADDVSECPAIWLFYQRLNAVRAISSQPLVLDQGIGVPLSEESVAEWLSTQFSALVDGLTNGEFA